MDNQQSRNTDGGQPYGKTQARRKERRIQSTDFSIGLTGKHIFGAYFNMARTNFEKTLYYILPIVGIRGKYKESDIDKMLHALYLIHSGQSDKLTGEQKGWKKKLTLTVEQQTRLQRLLFKHFPVLNPIMADTANYRAYLELNKKKSSVQSEDETFEQLKGISLADCLELFSLISDTLTECRNFYTHQDPYNEPVALEEQYKHQSLIAIKLNKVIEASRRVLKDREGLTTGEVEFLTGIDHRIQVDKKDENGNTITENGRIQKAFVEYDDFYFKVSGTRTIGLASYPALSDFGLLYFCVLFLSKHYAKLLIDESRLFEFSPFNENENFILQEMLSIYRIRTPQPHRIDSHDDKATLAMDIFSELRRCPIELYNLLDKDHGQPFFHDEVKRPNSFTPEVSKRLRFNDRFPHLALRYIDMAELFQRIRFQLQLGSFRYKFYDKLCTDGQTRVRRIQKDINGYGRLQEVDDKRWERWGDLIQKAEEHPVKLEHEELYLDLDQFVQDTAESTPYITDRRPSYNIHANRIGLFWEESKDTRGFKYFDKDKVYIPELTITNDGKASIKMPPPRCTLSVHDLPALLFYEYLRSQTDAEYKSAEKIIIDPEAAYRKFFSAVSKGEIKPFESPDAFDDFLRDYYPQILYNDIPEKIRLYLSSLEPTHNGKPETMRQRLVRLALDQLTQRQQQVMLRLKHFNDNAKRIGTKDNKLGKKGFADIRHGVLARYLVQDMMEWQPTKDGEDHDKLTSLNHNVLTAFLATYGTPQASLADSDTPKLTLHEVLQKACLVGGNNPHPFLNKVLTYNCRNIEEFYKNYLTAEESHLQKYINTLRNDPSDQALEALPFIHHTRARFRERDQAEIQALAARYTTIQLPDGLFASKIFNLLKEQYTDNPDLQQALNFDGPDHLNPTYNATYLIAQFYRHELKDTSQPFYNTDQQHTTQRQGQAPETFDFRRAYDLFAELNNEKPLFLTSDQIQSRLTTKRLDKSGKPLPQRDSNGKPQRDPQGNIIYQRKIMREIDKYVDDLSARDFKCKQFEVPERREAKREKLKRMVNETKNTERTLRRYRTQDMVLFLLAKQMFIKLLNAQDTPVDAELMCLSKVCNDNFLRQALTFRVPITVGDQKVIYVEQGNMSLVNYGEFFRLLTDERLPTLLKNIVDDLVPDAQGDLVISYNNLWSELAAYDRQRSTAFQLIQQIEALALKSNANLYNPDSTEFWGKGNNGPFAKRNSFSALIALIDRINTTQLTDDERRLLIAIRNSFAHNSYDLDLKQIDGIKKLPEVAKSILEHLKSVVGKG